MYPFRSVAVLLHPNDTVAVVTRQLVPGDTVAASSGPITITDTVPAGHKLAVQAIASGEPVSKYGQVIGYATAEIMPGQWVHTHNMHVGTHHLEYEFCTDIRAPGAVTVGEHRTFRGYRRADGRFGTRNYVAIISTVNCSADAASLIVERLRRDALTQFPNVDGVIAVTHSSGCGMAINGRGHRILQRCLAGMADHPNVQGALLVGLGCEVNQAAALVQDQGLIMPASIGRERVPGPTILTIQDSGGVQRTVDAGYREALKLLEQANAATRTELPISGLTVGTNCGGSDGNSGITANPALGLCGDELVRHGGAWLIGETSETYGAEHLLTRRAVSEQVGRKLVDLMRWWESYTAMHGATIDNNPAPGNKAGGLTTIFEKSLGAVVKSGTTPLREVYEYAERIHGPGFAFMDTPGLDNVSVTGLVAGGCNLVAFTTGRGSCLGFKPTPVLKIATTTALYERMIDDMDIDAGVVLTGTPLEELADLILNELVAVASGKKTKSELQGLGDHTFAPWMLGAVL